MTVLIIAGLDSSTRAGLTRDLAVIADHGMTALVAATAVTARDAAGGCAAMVARLIPLATLVTPNLPEAASLTGLESDAAFGALAAGLFGRGARAVLLKGGHGTRAEAVNWLMR
jgi:hydroxymethylpyrimidine/phosphomethylpyrimidine kinase